MIYEWQEGSRHSSDPQTLGELVESIAEREGACSPHALKEAVRDPDAPGHADVFRPGDPLMAAESWWSHQARRVINDIVVKVEGSSVRPAAFISVDVVRPDGDSVRGYRRRLDVQLVDTQHDQAVREALAALNGWRRRYGHLKDDPLLRDYFA